MGVCSPPLFYPLNPWTVPNQSVTVIQFMPLGAIIFHLYSTLKDGSTVPFSLSRDSNFDWVFYWHLTEIFLLRNSRTKPISLLTLLFRVLWIFCLLNAFSLYISCMTICLHRLVTLNWFIPLYLPKFWRRGWAFAPHTGNPRSGQS